jgi:hypothetical protein
MTDNKNRTSSDIRIAMNKRGGTLANPGAVAYNFDHKGVIQVLKNQAIEDELFLTVSEAGADDFEAEDDLFIITTPPDKLIQVKEAIDKLGVICESAELQMLPKNTVECSAPSFVLVAAISPSMRDCMVTSLDASTRARRSSRRFCRVTSVWRGSRLSSRTRALSREIAWLSCAMYCTAFCTNSSRTFSAFRNYLVRNCIKRFLELTIDISTLSQ